MHLKKSICLSWICILLLLILSACGSGHIQKLVTADLAPKSSSAQVTKQDHPADENASAAQSIATNEPVVFFTSDISAEGLVRLYQQLDWAPSGAVAVKISTGEPPASNYLHPELIGDLVRMLDGTIVECNTAYSGSRASSAMHRQVAEDHGFTAIAEPAATGWTGSSSAVARKTIRIGSSFPILRVMPWPVSAVQSRMSASASPLPGARFMSTAPEQEPAAASCTAIRMHGWKRLLKW